MLTLIIILLTLFTLIILGLRLAPQPTVYSDTAHSTAGKRKQARGKQAY